MSTPRDSEPVRETVGAVPVIVVAAVVVQDGGGALLTVRKRGTQRFQLPGGKPEPGETPDRTAVRECHEETGLLLDPLQLRLLGRFVAQAANEAGHQVSSTVYVHPEPVTREIHPAAEIEEIRWLDPLGPLPDDLAPMLSGNVVPALLED